jgi:ADP-ribose pyrophosphatase
MELKRLQRDILYQGKVFNLIVDQVEYPSGNRGIREIAEHPGGAVIVPILDDGRVILVRQLRYPLGRRILELPAGKLNPGEDPALAAGRELIEETGWMAGSLKLLTSMCTTPGFCDEILHLYLATQLLPSPGGHRREEGEFGMIVEMYPLKRAVEMVIHGEIEDGKTIVGLMLAERQLHST